MSPQPKHFYEFGQFRLDARDHLLLCDGEVVPLPPKTFDLLLALVESSGRVLTKEELMKQVWPDSFVEEANLSHHVFTLRKALGEDNNGGVFIETIPRRGYRFVAGVTEVQDESDEVVVAEHSRSRIVIEQTEAPGLATDYSGSDRTGRVLALAAGTRRRTVPLTLACAGALGLAVAIYFWSAGKTGEPTDTGVKSIAVLPFRPLVADSRNESLELGMADTLITKLSGIRQLIVRPMSAVPGYTGLNQDSLVAGRELGVDYVVEGNLQMEGEKVRATVRLLSVKDVRAIWTDKCDQQCSTLFELQDAVAQGIGGELALKLSGDERKELVKHYTENTEAYQLYLKGRYYWIGDRTEERMRKSIQYFNQAIDIDPNYALAYSGLADVSVVLSTFYVLPPREAFAKAKLAAIRALELDKRLAEAHAALSVIKLWYEWDWSGYQEEARQAIELSSIYAIAHVEFAQYLAAAGRFDEAIREAKRAQEIDPLSSLVNTSAGWIFYFARNYNEAIRRYLEVIEIYPDSFEPHRRLGLTYLQKKMNAEGLAEIQHSRTLAGENAEEIAYLGYAYGVTGKRAEAQKVLDQLQGQSKRRYVSPYLVALIYTGLSNNDQAFSWLEKAYEDRSINLVFLKVEPILDPLRRDPRFAELLQRMNLTP